jgi:ribose transport system permease protein
MLKVAINQPRASRPSAVLAGQWAWLFLLIILIVFSIIGRGFFSFFNLQNIVTDMAFVLLLAVGQTFVIISGGIDLSTGYIMGLATVVSAQVIGWAGNHNLPLLLAIVIGVAAGIVVGSVAGLVNGLIISRLSMPPFIVTLGMYGIARGAGFLLANGQPVTVTTNGIGAIGNNYLLYLPPGASASFFKPPAGLNHSQMVDMVQLLPFQLIIACVIVLVCAWGLSRTRFGLHVYAIGGNREAALRAGIPVARRTLQIYVLSAFLAALAGLLYMFHYTSGTADAGDPLLIDSIAAVTIGGASLFGGEGSMMGTLVGALIIAVIQNGLVIVGIDPFWQFIAVGVVIILAVLVDRAKARIVGA